MRTEGFRGALLRLALVTALLITPLLLLSPSPVHAALTPHAPVYINGNAGFTKPDPVNGGGSGTAGDPYIIENWEISAENAHGICIMSTTAHFVIRNCLVKNGNLAYQGIYLNNVRNGGVINCILRNNRSSGILLLSSRSNLISGNMFENNLFGIFLRRSDNNSIPLNTFKNSAIRIKGYSSNNIIYHNNFVNSKDKSRNLAPNPSFENGTLSPDGWIHDLSGVMFTWDNNFSHSGSLSAGIANPSRPWTVYAWRTSQYISVDPTKHYILSVWYRWVGAPADRQTAEIGISEYDENKTWIGGSGSQLWFFDDNQWHHSEDYYSLKPSTKYVIVSLQHIFRENVSDAEVRFDDIFFGIMPLAYDECNNSWDNGYPSGGNYWSDYVGEDNYQGENQDIEGSDGIGDTPYYIPGDNNLDRYPLMSPVIVGLVSHHPIYIEGNENFTPANGVVAGSGTENDPYIIENWDISAENTTGIFIMNTTAYFVIRNCYVHDGWVNHNDGIYLNNVQNGRIDNNLLENNYRSIYLGNSNNNLISNNTCENNTCENISDNVIYLYDGIYLYRSDNNTLTNNTCENNTYGIHLHDSSHDNLINNTCKNNYDGIYLYSSDNNTLSSNTCENNSWYGIRLRYSSNNNTLTNNTCKNSGEGIRLVDSSNNTLTNNTCENNFWYGIHLGYSDNNIVSNNVAEKNYYGIYISGFSDNNVIYHNNLVNNGTQACDNYSNYWDDGYPSGGNYWSDYAGDDNYQGENQDIPGSDGIGDIPYPIPGDSNYDRYPLMSSVIVGLVSHHPIYIEGNENFTPANGVVAGSGTENDPYIIENWDISAENAHGIEIRYTTAYFIVRNCYVHDGGWSYEGIKLENVQNGKIENLTSNNNWRGVFLEHSSNNTISNNTVNNNRFSILFLFSQNNTISNNVITGYDGGWGPIIDASSHNNIIENNFISNNWRGILLSASSNNTLRNNVLLNNYRNFCVYGTEIGHFYQDIDISNTIDGKPILYLIRVENLVFDENIDISYLGLVESDNIRVQNVQNYGILLASTSNSLISNCILSKSFDGVSLWSAFNNIISYNTIENVDYGIYARVSSNNNIFNNTMRNNYCGIFLTGESDNNLIKNNFIRNNQYGIESLWYSSNNTISNNFIENNIYGTYLWLYSDNNLIYHNNFVNNENQAYDECSNYWDDGYPFGGNYWSDYTGVDNYRGENQDVPGSDGIGDTPYCIPGDNNQDRYPLMEPWSLIIKGVKVSISPPHQSGPPGTTLVYTLTAKNTGSIADNYTLAVADTENWGLALSKNWFENVQPGENRQTTLAVLIPENAVACTKDNVTLTATSQADNTISDSLSCIAHVIGLASHDPILIDGNDNFIPANGVVGGSGTENDPYIIENWDISAGNAHGIEIKNTTVNFVVRNCYVHDGTGLRKYGIYLEYVRNGRIENNLVENNYWDGIMLDYSDNSLVSNNVVKNNLDGIEIHDSSNILVSNNLVENNDWDGIYLHFSDNNLVSNNVVKNNDDGIMLDYSDNNLVSNNVVKNNNDDGIELEDSYNNLVSNNVVKNNEYDGIELYYSDNNLISNNIVENNDDGIWLEDSDNNIISSNLVENNSSWCGIYLGDTYNNLIYHNNFVNNLTQANDEVSNYWDDGYPSGGNYWSDYAGADNYRGENQDIPGSDGIGDTPYSIGGGWAQDRYPLMNPWPYSRIVVNVAISPSYASGPLGGMLSYTVAITNMGNVVDNYDLSASDNSGWVLDLSDNRFENVMLGKNRMATLSVIIPENAAPGAEDLITVTATSIENENVSDSDSCIASVTAVRGVRVSISPSYQENLPGGTLSYTVTVINTSNIEDTYNLNANDTEGWLLELENSSLKVPVNENRLTKLKVTIPGNAISCTQDNITIFAASQENIEVSDNASCIAHVIDVRKVEVSIYPHVGEGLPGSELHFAVTVSNAGNVVDNYNLTASDNSGWGPELLVENLRVPAYSSDSTTLRVQIPEDASPCTEDMIIVTAISQTDNMVSDNDTCIAHVGQIGIGVSVSPDNQEGLPGSELNYTIFITNIGSLKDNCVLVVEDDAGWNLELSENRFEDLLPDEERSAILSVTIPENAPYCTEDNITVTATSQLGASASADVVAHVLEFRISISTDMVSYDRGENIEIYGEARLADNTPIVHAPILIEISVSGITRRFTSKTDLTGSYSYTFIPSSSEAGIYTARAVLFFRGYVRTDNTAFVIHGLYMTPLSVHLDMIANSQENVDIRLSNIGETELTGILPVLIDENENDNLTAILNTAAMKTQLQPGEHTTFNVKLIAGADLPHDAVFRIRVLTEQESIEEGEIRVKLHPNVPVGYVSPTDVRVSLNPGQWYTEPIVIANKGFGEWENVYLTPPSLAWISFAQPLVIGNLPAGAENVLDLRIRPHENVLPGIYRDNVTVMSSNYPSIIVNITITVTTAEKGGLLVHTVDILNRDVTGCSVTLVNQENSALIFRKTAEPDNAWIRFDNLPVGWYKCTVTSSLSEPVVRTVVIEPGIEKIITIKLDVPLVTVSYSLTPTTVPDVYAITLYITFETEIPQPILIAIPPTLDLPAKPGRSFQYGFRLWNAGLARVENVSISPICEWSRLKLEFLPSFIPKIEAGEEVSVAVKVTVDNTVKFGEIFWDNIEIEGAFSFFHDNQIKTYSTKTNLPVVVRISPCGELRIDPPLIFKIRGIFEDLLRPMKDISEKEFETESDLLTELHDLYWDNEIQVVNVTNMESGHVTLTHAHGIAVDMLKAWMTIGEIAEIAGEPLSPWGWIQLIKSLLDKPYATLHGYFDNAPSSENYVLEAGQTVPLYIYGIPENVEPDFFLGLLPLPTIWMGNVWFRGTWWENTRCRYSVPLLLIDFHWENITIGPWPGDGGGGPVTPSEVEPGVEVRISPYLQGGAPGETLSYIVSVITRGSAPTIYDLSVNSIWPAKLNRTTIISRIETAVLEVKVPDNAQHGDNDVITIIATSKDNSEFSDNASCAALCSISPRLLITPKKQIGLHPGDNLVYKVQIWNLASVADNFRLSVVKQVPNLWLPDWPTKFDKEIIEIGPNEVALAELTVTIPPTATFGEKRLIEVEARSVTVPISYDNDACEAILYPVVQILPPIEYGRPRENLLFATLIRNPLPQQENFSLAVESEWPATLGRDKIELGPEGYRFVGLEVALPDNAKFGDNVTIKVLATFSLGTASGTCKAMVAETFTERVQFRISQVAVLERDAFEARIDLTNNTTTTLTDVKIDLQILDNEGQDASDLFYVSPPSLSNISIIDGTGTIDQGKIASANWTIVPAPEAAGDNGRSYVLRAKVEYSVSGLSYTWDGEKTFTVYPQPELELDYYLPQRIVGNVPFFLAVSVKNVGKGVARNFRIVSSQPEIISDIAGVPVKLEIEGSWVKGENYRRALTLDFGDIPPGSSMVGAWKMVCNLSGRFVEFNAKFTHLTWGGERTSLIKRVGSHILVRQVINDAPGQDAVFDLLIDVDNDGVPDHILDIVTAENIRVKEVPAEVIGRPTYEDPTVLIRLEKENEWVYVSLMDILFGKVDIVNIVRTHDNKILDNRNLWQENGRIYFIDDPVTEYIIVYDRTQMKKVVVSIAPSYLSGSPGATLDYNVTVVNTGEVSDNFILTASDNLGWPISVPPAFLEIPAGQSDNAMLSVTVPSDATGCTEDNITVTSTSQSDNMVKDYDSCIAHAVIVRGIEVSILPSYQAGAPSYAIYYAVKVINTGNVEDTYTIENSDNAGWDLMLDNDLLTIPASENRMTTLRVTIPENASPSTKDNITVTAISQIDNTVSDSANCAAHVSVLAPHDSIYISLQKLMEVGADKRILKCLEKSLEADLWEDSTHLVSKHGHKVFSEEKKGVKKLMKEMKKKDFPLELVDDFEGAITMLLDADKILAQTAIDDAIAEEGDPKLIKKAEKEMMKAQEKWDKGKYDKSIDHYKKAWKHAQKALKHTP